MHYPTLGSTGCRISEIVLGAAAFGERVDDAVGDRIIGAAMEAGISTIDTADAYAGTQSEAMLGRILGTRRERLVLCTKVGLRPGDTEAELAAAFRAGGLDHAARWQRAISPNDRGLSGLHIRQAVEDSLRRLQTDHIDLYQVHGWDVATPVEETLRTLDDLVREGKVRYIGCSSFRAWQLYAALRASDAARLTSFCSMQASYSLIDRDVERDTLPACRAAGVGILAFSVLAAGLLSGRFSGGRQPGPDTRIGSRRTFLERYWSSESLETVARLEKAAAETGRSPAQLALGWVLANRDVNAVVLGASQPDQVGHLTEVADRPLSPDELAAVAACTPA